MRPESKELPIDTLTVHVDFKFPITRLSRNLLNKSFQINKSV